MTRLAPLSAALAGAALFLTGPAHAEKVDIPVPKTVLVKALNAGLDGTKVHVSTPIEF
ncbi:MAG TPA: hypothetical protein VF193_01130 [Steroidobacter sp.]|jgi:hypothetical protein